MWCLYPGAASLEVSDSRGEGMGQRAERLEGGAGAQTVLAWLFEFKVRASLLPLILH